MTEYNLRNGLQVAQTLIQFIEQKALPGTGVSTTVFWQGLADLVNELGPKNKALLAHRSELQGKIDQWHIRQRNQPHGHETYKEFLKVIGYLVQEGPDFEIKTKNVDPEIATIPGPQLVVPVTNARYALNAANARWGSLYDCLYGTDAMGNPAPQGGYDRGHGARVVALSLIHI